MSKTLETGHGAMARGQQFRRINIGNAEGSSSGELTSVMQMPCRCRAQMRARVLYYHMIRSSADSRIDKSATSQLAG